MPQRRAQALSKFLVFACALAALIVGGTWGWQRFGRSPVTVTDVIQGPVVKAFYSTGTIQPIREYPVRSNIAAIIKDVRVDKGSRVKKDDVLAIVEDPALAFTEQKAQAELEEKLARADEKQSPVLGEFDAKISAMNDMLEIAKREQKRVSDLLEHQAGSPVDLDRAMDRVKECWSDCEAFKAQKAAKILELRREVEVAQAALNVARWDVQQQTLRAPIDGVVLDRPTSVGTRVAINDQIMRVADVAPENLVMRAAVDEEDIAKVREGQTVRMTLYAFPDDTFSGTVTRIYDQADPDRRTFEVEVKFSDLKYPFQPGMTGELAFVMAEKASALIVPAQALQDGVIWIVRDSHLVKTTPKIGIRSVERVEVMSDLKAGDRVVISPVSDGRDGAFVSTTWTAPQREVAITKSPSVGESLKAFNK